MVIYLLVTKYGLLLNYEGLEKPLIIDDDIENETLKQDVIRCLDNKFDLTEFENPENIIVTNVKIVDRNDLVKIKIPILMEYMSESWFIDTMMDNFKSAKKQYMQKIIDGKVSKKVTQSVTPNKNITEAVINEDKEIENVSHNETSNKEKEIENVSYNETSNEEKEIENVSYNETSNDIIKILEYIKDKDKQFFINLGTNQILDNLNLRHKKIYQSILKEIISEKYQLTLKIKRFGNKTIRVFSDK